MFKYYHIIKFLMTHDLTFLKECWEAEIICGSKFGWFKLLNSLRKQIKLGKPNYLFYWRLANEMYLYGTKKQKKVATIKNRKMIFKYNIDITLGARIGKNLTLGHNYNIVINRSVIIGENFTCLHNVTIGQNKEFIDIKIGDNVTIGTGTVILGGQVTIGSNVVIGAMSFINKDIPDNCTFYTEKNNKIIVKKL